MDIIDRESLIEYISRGNKVKYLFFWGHHKHDTMITKSCFSQWYDSPFETDNKRFATAEHFMMHHKALLFGDTSSAEKVLSASNPGAAKAIGREVKDFNEQMWLENRFAIVVNANLAKFSNHPELSDFLLSTGNRVLVEASPVDKIWGVGLAETEPSIENPNLWKGLNLLGFALMVVRNKLSKTN